MQSSYCLVLLHGNPSTDVSALSLECKMDIVSCDVDVFNFYKSPANAIESLIPMYCGAVRAAKYTLHRSESHYV